MPNSQITSPANPDEAEYWNSAAGQKWVDYQVELDTLLLSVKQRLMQRTKPVPGDRVLDIGCGTGATTNDIASLVGGDGLAIGIDISSLLLDRAKQCKTEAKSTNVDYLLADAQTHSFEPGGFDLLFSKFGVMFFSDPVAAFKNLSLALRPGGRLSFVSWSALVDNPWFKVSRDAAIEQLGKPSAGSPTAPGPFAFADKDRVIKILQDAGFKNCSCDVEHVNLFYPGEVEDAAFLANNLGPSVRIVKEFQGSRDDVAEIVRRTTDGFQKFAVEGGVNVPATLNFFDAVI